MASTSIPQICVFGAKPPLSIIYCLVFMFDWCPTAVPLPSRVTKSHTGNGQYKHSAQEIFCGLESALQNLNANRHKQWLFTLRAVSNFDKLPTLTDRLMNVASCILSSLYWRLATLLRIFDRFVLFCLSYIRTNTSGSLRQFVALNENVVSMLTVTMLTL